jgi:hypothetical protein
MKTFRAQWNEAGTARKPAPQLRVVSRVSPPRPRWGVLYVALATVVGLGVGVHLLIQNASLIVVADWLFSFTLFAVLVGWVQGNRVALSRMNEPRDGHERARVRVVRPGRNGHAARAEEDESIVRLDPDDRVILPYDFR